MGQKTKHIVQHHLSTEVQHSVLTMTTIPFKRLLQKHVADAAAITDLIPLLSEIFTLEQIQGILHERIQKLDSDAERGICFTALPIQTILPIDLIQYIISFTDSSLVQYINKTFKQCFDQNKNIMLRERQSVIDKEEFTPKIKYDEIKNKTWVVHPYRTVLNEAEITRGYQGPLNDIQDATTQATSGDIILVHDGVYNESSFELHKELQIIGIGDVHLHVANGVTDQSIFLKNITIICTKFIIRPPASIVWMENCEFASESLIFVHNGSLNAKNCLFNGGKVLLLGSQLTRANIIGCVFRNFRRECIRLIMPPIGKGNNQPCAIKCVGNIFKDNRGHAITVLRHTLKGDEEDMKLECVLKHNLLQGYNSCSIYDCEVTSEKIMRYTRFRQHADLCASLL
eukprot:499984_1